jgi:ubiquinone/menaquinone biosynthesis C-methylase UbiE
MLDRILKAHVHVEGGIIERVRLYEIVCTLAFRGRRRRVYGRVVALSGARPGDRVLDVGCGGGYLARLVAAAVGQGGRVTGVDPSAAAIARARHRRRPANTSFEVGFAQHLDLPNDSFDIVTSTFAVHHIPKSQRAAAFREMYRVTRPGGRIVVADFRPSGLSAHLFGHGMRHNDPDLLDGLAVDAGFRVEARGDLPMLRYVQAVRPAAV